MQERKEYLRQVGDVREMSRQILSQSTDLLTVDDAALESVLIPRIEQYLENQRAGGWTPAGAELPLEQELGLNLFLNVVNFCYKDPDTGKEYVYSSKTGRQIKRATGLLAALAESGVRWDDFFEVFSLGKDEWAQMIQLNEYNPMYLGTERGQRVSKVALHELSRGHETITDYLEDCDYNAVNIMGSLSENGYFKDDFLKRAQLAARMISDVLLRRTGTPLIGMDKLTVMADYRIPQVFYNLPGVVDIKSDDLLYNLVNGMPIEAGSRQELALRATAVSIGEKVSRRMGVIEADIDGYLWGLSQEMVKKDEMSIPHMIVATDAY